MAVQTTMDPFVEFNTFRSEKPSFDIEDWSEADTRSKLIDRLLIKCLGWPESSIRDCLKTQSESAEHES
jgi:hypothetical protein